MVIKIGGYVLVSDGEAHVDGDKLVIITNGVSEYDSIIATFNTDYIMHDIIRITDEDDNGDVQNTFYGYSTIESVEKGDDMITITLKRASTDYLIGTLIEMVYSQGAAIKTMSQENISKDNNLLFAVMPVINSIITGED